MRFLTKSCEIARCSRATFLAIWVVGITTLVVLSTMVHDRIVERDNANELLNHERSLERSLLASVSAWPGIQIFYNVYTGPGNKSLALTKRIVKEQLLAVKHFHHLNVITIGQKLQDLDLMCKDAGVSCKHSRHVGKAPELLTLKMLYDHCQHHPSHTVGYIHSKGSYHPRPGKNDILRRALTRATLSVQCALMPTEATSCSYSVSALPHFHTPGNMWVAKCSYINKLISPYQYVAAMDSIQIKYNLQAQENHLVPCGRFAAEHWVHSHPDNIPYDLYDSPGLTHSYINTPENDHWPMKLTAPPRHGLLFSFAGSDGQSTVMEKLASNVTNQFYPLWGIHLNARVAEWHNVYKQIPRNDSWLWKFYTAPAVKTVMRNFKMPWINSTEINALNAKYNIHLPVYSSLIWL